MYSVCVISSMKVMYGCARLVCMALASPMYEAHVASITTNNCLLPRAKVLKNAWLLQS